jgi:hypothetical protein
MIRRIVHGLLWILVVPMLTYWFVAKSFWVHTELEKLLLAGLVLFGALMFIAIMRTRHSKPAVYVAATQDVEADATVDGARAVRQSPRMPGRGSTSR